MHFNDRILVIDDNLDNLMILQELLEGEYTVRCAKSGDEGLRIAKKFKPDLVLLDVMMPGMNGHETCDSFRANPQLRSTKVVMVSALGEVRDRLAAYQFGAVDYITKPFNEKELLAKVHAWIGVACREQVDAIWGEIDAMGDAIGTALLKTASFRDVETGEHLIRIRIYSSAIAMQLSLEGPYRSEIDRDFKSQLFRASPLHDIGKVGVADAILQKHGALTNAEWDIMRQHVGIGAEILQKAAEQMPRADYLQMAVDVARHHHERFDGSGYPDGLAGAKIPLSARIVAVADALDALTSKRVYKEAVPIDKALQIIEASAGTHFDPIIVDALRKRIDVFRHIVDRCTEKVGAAS